MTAIAASVTGLCSLLFSSSSVRKGQIGKTPMAMKIEMGERNNAKKTMFILQLDKQKRRAADPFSGIQSLLKIDATLLQAF